MVENEHGSRILEWPLTMKTDGKTEDIDAGEKFREIMLTRYGKS